MSTTATLNQHFGIKSILINPSPLIVKIWQLFLVHAIHSLFRIQYYFIFNSHHTNLTFTFLIQTEVLFLDESGYVKDDDDEDSTMMGLYGDDDDNTDTMMTLTVVANNVECEFVAGWN